MRIHPPGDGTESVLWHVHTLEGNYRLKLWRFNPMVPEVYATNSQYYIVHRDGITIKTIDWRSPVEEGWENLGRYVFTDHESQGVWLSDAADGYLIADAVKIISTSPIGVDRRIPLQR